MTAATIESLVGWIDRVGWNWGAAIVSGTTALSLTVPGVLPHHPSPASTPLAITVLTGAGPSGRGPGSPGSTSPRQPGPPGSGSTTGSPGGGSTPPSGAPAPPEASPPPGVTPTPGPSPSGSPTPTPSPTPVPDPPPVVTGKAGGAAILGDFTGSGSFTDSDFAAHTFTATVNYGDGTGTHALALSGATFVLSHRYATILGKYTVTVTVTDDEGVSGSGSTTVTVVR